MNDLVLMLPRYHTALAEWLSCLVYVILMKRRYGNRKTCVVMVSGLLLLIASNIIGERVPIVFWLLFMLLGLGIMYALLYFCCDLPATEAGYCWCRGFLAAELAASLEWQIYYYIFLQDRVVRFWLSNLCMVLVYLVFFLFLFRWEKRQKMNPGKGQISAKELSGAIVIAVTAFFVSNFSFAFRNNVFSESLGEGILMVRTLVDFAGLILLYAHQEMRQESYLRFELEASDRLFQHQYEQYQLYRANHEQIRKIYHDLKHQVDVIRLETDQQKREKYLSEISKTLRVYETESQTGNPVLDTVLSGKRLQCEKQGIRIVVFVDAKKLGFMDVMDICSLFGNALDNAIESVSKLEDPEKRMVKVSVFSKNSFVLLQFENYFEDELKLTEGLPETTKKNAELHGIGLKSMRAIAEKYGGNLTINMENHWFTVTLLLPIPQEEQV